MKELSYYELLAKSYPSIESCGAEIINLKAIINLPKGTEHFLSDIHGEYDAFNHMIRSGSGVIRDKIDENFPTLSKTKKDIISTIIYYPKEKLYLLEKEHKLTDKFLKEILFVLIEVAKITSSKYTISKVRKTMSSSFNYIIEELIQSHSYTYNKEDYYSSIVDSIIETDLAKPIIIEISKLIQRLSVDHLHILGDIYDRGDGAYKVMDVIMEQKHVDITWGNHDIYYIGAAAGSKVCIANVIRNSCRYNHLNTIEDGYGISLRPLIAFALKTYHKANIKEFIPSKEEANDVLDYDTKIIAKMHKAITIILFKLEGQLVSRHPEYQGDYMLKLKDVDFTNFTYTRQNKTYNLIDHDFPTIDKDDPYKLTKDESELMDKLSYAFSHCDRLHRHTDFLVSHGSMYLTYNSNLLFHGAIPTLENGNFFEYKDESGTYRGKSYLDHLDKLVRRAYYERNKDEKDLDIFYYLWCFKNSPLYGKSDITTFERYFLSKEDRKDFKETKNPYYRFINDSFYCEKVLFEFGLTSAKSRIINGHMPVKTKDGESPIKAHGKYIVIDGGMSKPYQHVTGIAGYTLIYNSHGYKLIEHNHFTSKDNAIKNNLDIARVKNRLDPLTEKDRMKVSGSDVGKELSSKIEDLTTLLELYKNGTFKSR